MARDILKRKNVEKKTDYYRIVVDFVVCSGCLLNAGRRAY